jgi:hypothetical protein
MVAARAMGVRGRAPQDERGEVRQEGDPAHPEAQPDLADGFVTKMYFTAMGDYEMHNRVVVFEADRSIAWEPGNPKHPRNGSRWRFDLTPESSQVTVVTETYDCTGSPESVRKAVDNGNAWLAGMTKTLERIEEVCTAH